MDRQKCKRWRVEERRHGGKIVVMYTECLGWLLVTWLPTSSRLPMAPELSLVTVGLYEGLGQSGGSEMTLASASHSVPAVQGVLFTL